MGKSAPSPPPAPDYLGAAKEQGQANLNAAQQGAVLSNPNINSPLGNQSVSYNNITGPDGQTYMQPNVNQSYTPQAQQTLSAQQAVQFALARLGQQATGTASGIIGQQFNPQNVGLQTSLGGYGQLPDASQYNAQGHVNDPSLQMQLNTDGVAALPVNAGQTGQQAIMARLQPTINQQNASNAQNLANQGINIGSEAWNNAMRAQSQGNNDLYSQAALQGINLDMQNNQLGMQNALTSGNFANNAQLAQFGAGMQNAGLYNQAQGQNLSQALGAQNQGFNQSLQGAQFGNQAALQNYQQQLAQYNQPLNQIAALMSGSQIQTPQFQGYTGQNVQAAPIANATTQLGQYQQNIYGQQVAASNAQSQGLGSLLGAGASILAAPMTGGTSLAGAAASSLFSDVRLKSNIERVGTHKSGIGIYDYDIFGERHRGVMAHEVETVMPEAVSMHSSGFKMVNYEAINA